LDQTEFIQILLWSDLTDPVNTLKTETANVCYNKTCLTTIQENKQTKAYTKVDCKCTPQEYSSSSYVHLMQSYTSRISVSITRSVTETSCVN